MLQVEKEKIYKFLDLLIKYNIPFCEEPYIIKQMKEETIDKILTLTSREEIIHILTEEITDIKNFYENYKKFKLKKEPLYFPSFVSNVDFWTRAGTYKYGLRKLQEPTRIMVGNLKELNPDPILTEKLEKLKKL